MKNIKLFIVLAAALCLASCDSIKPKANEENTKQDAMINVVLTEEDRVSETPFEWSPDLLWDVFLAYADLHHGYDFDEDYSVQSIREDAEQTYFQHRKMRGMHIPLYKAFGCGGEDVIICFKYQDENKLYVFYESEEGCAGGCHMTVYSFTYDLITKSLTEIEHPFMPLDCLDFFDELMLLDRPDENVDPEDPDYEDIKNMFEIDSRHLACEFYYTFRADEADFMLRFASWYCPQEFCERGKQLAYDWDGQTFVRKPEADIMGTTIFEDGFCGIKFGTEIPTRVPGFRVYSRTYSDNDGEELVRVIEKDDRLVMEIGSDVDEEQGVFTNTVWNIDIYDECYQTTKGCHVGSNANEVLAAYSGQSSTVYLFDGEIWIDTGTIHFIVSRDDYDGEINETEDESITIIQQPTFKPEARVKMIRLGR